MADGCQNCMTRVPYATLVATIMCLAGVGVYCGTMYRGAALTRQMFSEVFHFRVEWLDSVQLTFVIVGACMGALGIMILFVGCLTTGETRRTVYKAWRARVGGRVTCAVFMVITYILEVAWLGMFCFLTVVTATFSIFWSLCAHKPQPYDRENCIDFQQFYFLFPNSTRVDDWKVCETHEIKLFCKDYVERATIMFILASVASVLVIMSLIHYLMCLSANYAHIKDHEKLQDFQELQYFTGESEMTALASKDRY